LFAFTVVTHFMNRCFYFGLKCDLVKCIIYLELYYFGIIGGYPSLSYLMNSDSSIKEHSNPKCRNQYLYSSTCHRYK